MDDLSAEILLPFVRFQVEQDLPDSGILTVDNLLVHHLLLPLVEWGLLEGRYEEDYKGLPPTLKQVRTTSLYDEFVEIDI